VTESSERLRGSERTAEGVHLPEPDDAFPHVVMGRLAMLLVGLAAAAWGSYALGGVVGVFIGGLVFLFVVLPFAIRRMSFSARANRELDLEEEREREDLEHEREDQDEERITSERPAVPPPDPRAPAEQPAAP
jgi:hypothetical protein